MGSPDPTPHTSLRAAILAEAKTWLGTPYHGNADVKGAGVDCGMFPLRVYSACGLIDPGFDPRPYPMQWSFHQIREKYLELVLSFGYEVLRPLAGDLVVFKIGKSYGHGAIVVEWPRIIHANPPGVCRYDDAEHNSSLMRLTNLAPPRFFSIWKD